MSNFGAILTNAGAAKLANAIALGVPLKLTQMAVADGNGQPVAPDPAMTAIPGEKRRAAINTLFADPLAASQLVAEQIIPEDVGGWWIRCVGLYDDSNTLIAIANVPDTYKPLLTSGAGRTQIIRMVLIVSDTSAVELKIDPSVVLATRKYVDDVMKAHKESRDHPDATELAKGFTKYANLQKALAGEDNLAVTPKVMKAVLAALGLTKYGAPMIGVPIDWPLAQMPQDIWPDCGMVFLSCAGQGFNKTTYPFAAQLYPSGVMPEHRGEFSRGWDNGRGVDPGRQLLSYQAATQLPSIYTYSSGPGLGVLVTPPINSYTGSSYPLEKPATDYESPVNGSGAYFTTQQALTPSGSAALSTFRVHSRSIAYHKIMRVE
ncbi:phage tail protein [Aeromonas veronii]|uniref:phage tail protein n=1 Tax=Aeromonas veronii TaxID=654 RepID=UPI001F2E713E|nr:phage tail protein [Aeromonas veronii]